MNALPYRFENELRDLYFTEKQLLDFLPIMINISKDLNFNNKYESLVQNTNHNFKSLEHICKKLKIKTDNTVCTPVKHLIKDINTISKKHINVRLKQIQFIVYAQRIQLYKLSGYGSATRLANELGYTEISELLQALLNHEFYTDSKLNTLAVKRISEKTIC